MVQQPWRKRARDDNALLRETTALRLLGGPVVRLLGVAGHELLLERITPGSAVSDLPEDEATAALAAALQAMWVPVPLGCDLPTARDECVVLGDPRVTHVLPSRLVSAALTRVTELESHAPTPVVLHGDLHHGNLLWSADRAQWVAIDPHGLTGDPAYDVGPLLLNPWGSGPERLASRRLDLLTELLGIGRDRLAGWGLVRAVLAAAWTVQDSGRVDEGPLRVAEALLA